MNDLFIPFIGTAKIDKNNPQLIKKDKKQGFIRSLDSVIQSIENVTFALFNTKMHADSPEISVNFLVNLPLHHGILERPWKRHHNTRESI